MNGGLLSRVILYLVSSQSVSVVGKGWLLVVWRRRCPCCALTTAGVNSKYLHTVAKVSRSCTSVATRTRAPSSWRSQAARFARCSRTTSATPTVSSWTVSGGGSPSAGTHCSSWRSRRAAHRR
eukprot:5528764-Pyramimonas_sp.AAC.1